MASIIINHWLRGSAIWYIDNNHIDTAITNSYLGKLRLKKIHPFEFHHSNDIVENLCRELYIKTGKYCVVADAYAHFILPNSGIIASKAHRSSIITVINEIEYHLGIKK